MSQTKYIADVYRAGHHEMPCGKITIIVEGFKVRSDLDNRTESTIQSAIEFILPEDRRIRILQLNDSR